MTIKENPLQTCEKCEALAAILELPPWKWDGTYEVTSGPRTHSIWCHRRTRYEVYKQVGTCIDEPSSGKRGLNVHPHCIIPRKAVPKNESIKNIL